MKIASNPTIPFSSAPHMDKLKRKLCASFFGVSLKLELCKNSGLYEHSPPHLGSTL